MDQGWVKALGIGGLIVLGGKAAWQSLSPETKQKIDAYLGEVLANMERQRHEKEQQQWLAQQFPPLPPLDTTWVDEFRRDWDAGIQAQSDQYSSTSVVPPAELIAPVPREDSQWHTVISDPAIVLIIGKRGSGKSALAYRLLENLRYRSTPYLVGAPDEARGLLPEWIGLAPSLKEVPAKSIVLVDEAYLRHHARESQAKDARTMSQLLNLSRQREQTLIFVTQEARQIDRNIASSASVIIFKEPGPLQPEFERPELRRIAQQATSDFESIKKRRASWSYVYSPDVDFAGMIENELPTFWTTRLSRVFGTGQGASALSHPARTTIFDRRVRARELRNAGLSYSAIGRELGVSKSTAINYLKSYPNK